VNGGYRRRPPPSRAPGHGEGTIQNSAGFTAEQDRKTSTEVIAIASQGGLGLPEGEYYTKTDEESKKLRERYEAHVARMLQLLGDDPAKAAADAKTIMTLETRLAVASMTPVEQRDSEKTYNRMDAAKLAALTPNWSWSAYFDAVGVRPAAVNVAQPKFFEAVDREMRATPISSWKAYLRWELLNDAAPSLSKTFAEADFDFYGKILQGTPENEARWKRCVLAADGALGQALGKAYVRDYFPPEAKAAADKMVKNLVAALREDLKTPRRSPGWARPHDRRPSRSSPPSARRSATPTCGATIPRSRSIEDRTS
jgi:putative endopeptidase